MKSSKAKVYLIGGGPGDPGLITLRGAECIGLADVIVYDYLSHPSLLKHAAPSAEKIYVGKKGGEHTLSQDKINALLIEKAGAGLTVARLKGGDPFIFGRGGEEAEALVREGIPFEVVPGVTSAIAVPAYAGIPLTHRKLTQTVAFVTGHEEPGKEDSGIDWASLAKGIGTIVFFMGVKNLPFIVGRLIENGMPPDKPVAVIRWGTTPAQKTVAGTLSDIVERVVAAGLKAPAITVIGDVVNLRNDLAWFESRPLLGKTVVVTRAREQASELVRMLSDLGAECIECPTIAITPPADYAPLDSAIETLSERGYDWLIFTSVNGVDFFFERLFEKGGDVRAIGRAKIAAIGPATSRRLENYGLRSDLVPEDYRAESIIDAFSRESIAGKKILLPRATEARPILPAALAEMGGRVEEVPAYLTREDRSGAEEVIRRLSEGKIDLITFTSSSTARNFRALLPDDRFEALLRGVTIASIGPITTDTARGIGFDVRLTAETYTIPGLLDAILAYYD
jgi:uroporphyrinogen III methyltransferase/synthase